MHELYGVWHVTTLVGSEAERVVDLGVHLGNVQDIAFHLADKCGYFLIFNQIKEPRQYKPTRGRVLVQIQGDSRFMGKDGYINEPQVENLQTILGKEYKVGRGGPHETFLIDLKDWDQKAHDREKVLSKLTPGERKILGF